MGASRRRILSRKQLAHYRRYCQEAIGEDFIICLECGSTLRSLVAHLSSMHGMSTNDYREKWGYKRLTALMDLETRLKFTQGFWARWDSGFRYPIHRKVEDDTIRRLFAKDPAVPAIAAKTGLTQLTVYARLYKLRLSRRRVPNEELLRLARRGLWVSQIAARTGLVTGTIYSRLARLRKRGAIIPRPRGPRPQGYDRRVGAERFLALVRRGLTPDAMAARLGIRPASVKHRLWMLRKRGLVLPSTLKRGSWSIVSDARLLALCREGIGPAEIATRLGLPYSTVAGRLHSLRRRGLLPKPPPRPGPSRERVSDSELLKLVRAGFGTRLIADRTGLGVTTVMSRLKALPQGTGSGPRFGGQACRGRRPDLKRGLTDGS